MFISEFDMWLSCSLVSYFQALVLEVCDETDVAELKVKVHFHSLFVLPLVYVKWEKIYFMMMF